VTATRVDAAVEAERAAVVGEVAEAVAVVEATAAAAGAW